MDYLEDSTNWTYMIECEKCNKQYIGETKRTLRERFTEHRRQQTTHVTPILEQPSLHISIYQAIRQRTWELSHLSFS